MQPAVYPAPPCEQALAMRFDVRGRGIMARRNERPGSSATLSQESTIIVTERSMATPGSSGSTVPDAEDQPRSGETLRYRTHHCIEMSELLGGGPGGLHAQDELIGSEVAEEISDVDFSR
jgi:hypothetical protein